MKEISQKATMHKAFNHYVISKGVSAKDKSAMLQMKFVAEVGSCQKLESVVSVELFNACQRVEKKFQSKHETSVLQQDIAMMLSGSASSVLLRDVISPMAGSFGKDLHEQAVRIINDVTKNHASLEELKAAQKQELAEKQKIFEAAGNSMGQEQVEGLAEGRLYKVKKGDSLVKISEKSGVQLTEILKQNPGITDANKIKAGQVLYLGEKGVEALKHSSQTSASFSQKGDNNKLTRIEIDANGKMRTTVPDVRKPLVTSAEDSRRISLDDQFIISLYHSRNPEAELEPMDHILHMFDKEIGHFSIGFKEPGVKEEIYGKHLKAIKDDKGRIDNAATNHDKFDYVKTTILVNPEDYNKAKAYYNERRKALQDEALKEMYIPLLNDCITLATNTLLQAGVTDNQLRQLLSSKDMAHVQTFAANSWRIRNGFADQPFIVESNLLTKEQIANKYEVPITQVEVGEKMMPFGDNGDVFFGKTFTIHPSINKKEE